MLRARIIPVLLLRDKGLVKTRRFREDKYVGDPINAVKIFNEKEVDELALFDIDATVKGRRPDFEHLRKIAVESRMPLCYGGGVSSAEQAAEIIALGFEKVSVSAAALVRPELIQEMADRIGRQSVVVTLDVCQRGIFNVYTICSHNGTRRWPAKLPELVREFERLGAGEIVINNIDRDGMMQGYDLALAKLVRESVNIPITLIGGAGRAEDMADLVDAVGIVGAGAGSLFVFKGVYRAVLISYARPAFERPRQNE